MCFKKFQRSLLHKKNTDNSIAHAHIRTMQRRIRDRDGLGTGMRISYFRFLADRLRLCVVCL